MNTVWKTIVEQDGFERLVAALAAANFNELPRTSAMLRDRLLAKGCWQDVSGTWHTSDSVDTRPMKSICDDDLAAGWEY